MYEVVNPHVENFIQSYRYLGNNGDGDGDGDDSLHPSPNPNHYPISNTNFSSLLFIYYISLTINIFSHCHPPSRLYLIYRCSTMVVQPNPYPNSNTNFSFLFAFRRPFYLIYRCSTMVVRTDWILGGSRYPSHHRINNNNNNNSSFDDEFSLPLPIHIVISQRHKPLFVFSLIHCFVMLIPYSILYPSSFRYSSSRRDLPSGYSCHQRPFPPHSASVSRGRTETPSHCTHCARYSYLLLTKVIRNFPLPLPLTLPLPLILPLPLFLLRFIQVLSSRYGPTLSLDPIQPRRAIRPIRQAIGLWHQVRHTHSSTQTPLCATNSHTPY